MRSNEFKIGDKVKITRISGTDGSGIAWVPSMNRTVGELGIIDDIADFCPGWIRVRGKDFVWNYPVESLEKIEPDHHPNAVVYGWKFFKEEGDDLRPLNAHSNGRLYYNRHDRNYLDPRRPATFFKEKSEAMDYWRGKWSYPIVLLPIRVIGWWEKMPFERDGAFEGLWPSGTLGADCFEVLEEANPGAVEGKSEFKVGDRVRIRKSPDQYEVSTIDTIDAAGWIRVKTEDGDYAWFSPARVTKLSEDEPEKSETSRWTVKVQAKKGKTQSSWAMTFDTRIEAENYESYAQKILAMGMGADEVSIELTEEGGDT